ncbi:conserved hypothetical protein [Xenorhabdus nematophila F1]|uniref:Uncharacterized protein n=1 Tax=Xenorhabdus nematophila (strain ATCC 19061 / DSM 3370 / CCUG 14189 / LMG 1036 / NCIMB 9965 / AN6) TaxID=406817 RepID=D3VJZ1_XENNA|nr:hypothetical protein XNC1_2996 [Xenorhabdus nematophila ATCC 19061]CCW31979.1 conserved hypothetical protein [Xenorhabdus nematophila F1]CEK23871.1 hypothetical protein XNC2_2877 [Xenorhabdus nematophila AN6/1]
MKTYLVYVKFNSILMEMYRNIYNKISQL